MLKTWFLLIAPGCNGYIFTYNNLYQAITTNLLTIFFLLFFANAGWCETPSLQAQNLDLSPEVIKQSPVLQRWQQQVPNVLEDIQNDPSFRTRLRVGYSQFPSDGQVGGINVGVEDIYIGKSGLTFSADYQAAFNGERKAYGINMNYYLRPLGNYINIAPLVGYRYLEGKDYSSDGLNLGAKLLFVISRGGAADISLTQSWVAPGTSEEVGFTKLSVGYALTHKLRVSTDIEKQNTRHSQDSRVGVVLEWILGL
jgi:hypothetical protein